MLFLINQSLLKMLLLSMLSFMLAFYAPAGLSGSHVTVLLSLPDKLESAASVQIKSALDASLFQTTIYPLSQLENTSTLLDHLKASGELILAAGRDSCEYASVNLQYNNVLCVLISTDAFTQIKLQRSQSSSDLRFAAIVLDQPIERQVKVASSVFPSLKNFGVLASSQEHSFENIQDNSDGVVPRVKVDKFNKERAVAPQVVKVLAGQDALVATPDKNVYSTDQLRTVLLTAYGYAKPVIGYSRAYVRAGALITTFTTPEQVFKQAAQMLEGFISSTDIFSSSVYDPMYFSIVDNPSIAKSLGLVRRFGYVEGQDYVDQDFFE